MDVERDYASAGAQQARGMDARKKMKRNEYVARCVKNPGGSRYALPDEACDDLCGSSYRDAVRPLLADEALDLAAAEGLTLLREPKNRSGFKYVKVITKSATSGSRGGCKRPYEAWGKSEGKSDMIWLAKFATAEEAALCVARHAADPAAFKASLAEEIRKYRGKRLQAEVEAAEQKRLRDERAAQKTTRKAAREQFKAEAQRVREATARQHAELAARQQQELREAAQRAQQYSRQQATAHGPAYGGAPPETTRVPAMPDLESAPLEQVVAHVLVHRGDAHRCLGLKRADAHEVVRKRFLALALRLHPDKASHPQAREAFTAVDAASKALLASGA